MTSTDPDADLQNNRYRTWRAGKRREDAGGRISTITYQTLFCAIPGIEISMPLLASEIQECVFPGCENRCDELMTLAPDYLRPTEAAVNWGLKPMPEV